MSTFWTVIIIVIILAIIFWLILSQNKEDTSEENEINLNEPLEGDKETQKEDQEKKEGE